MNNSENTDGKSVKILVVDDEEIVLSLARDALEDAGYKISLASNADEATFKMKREYFDFILTDIRMPGMNGLELSRLARDLIPSIGVIFMTGYANLNTAKDAIKEGAYDYIMKPFELNELRQAVKNAIKKKQKDTEKTLSSELDRLSDLNQLMYTISDRKSLMRLSLGFAMMQSKISKGSIVYRNNNKNEIGIISTSNLEKNEFNESVKLLDNICQSVKVDELENIQILDSIDEHPFFASKNDSENTLCLESSVFDDQDKIANLPLKRGDKLYGFLMLGYPKEGDELKENDLKLLSITASQITISLENIILLEESREAYSRLKELQDETLQLERMAAQGQMSSEIGHELNNFLGVIMGNLSLMQYHLEKKNYDELDKYFVVVSTNLDNIKNFTDGLMDVSKLKSKFESCNMATMVDDVIKSLKAQNRFDDIEISFEKSSSDVFALIDTRQFQQLLYNLINNSADALGEITDNRKKQITVGIKNISENNDILLSIVDNGLGIDENYLDCAFKKRFTTKETGHGFGLLVCDKIIQHHQGKLEISSTENIGTSITITFPSKISTNTPQPVG